MDNGVFGEGGVDGYLTSSLFASRSFPTALLVVINRYLLLLALSKPRSGDIMVVKLIQIEK